ncbi:GNAT family N-acetyltransferase [Paenibacillus radicis (ex Gao et al. 2016)]|uniref:Acetyltransferase n=1 Tax=Paenibacillus radicis (ex Gao et al. 2016) TaxID=1737354 RepID=A0A917H6D1_9BACL|nr:GNAT family protein [Paenibacillus radicis (ex Gao et al. 2016)]GGG69202.1 acetyltransferase [Paenibacillus radicis (ex Gao et al. 2016)]
MKIIGNKIRLRNFTEDDFSFYNELEQNPITHQYESSAPDDAEIQNDFQKALSEVHDSPRERYELAINLKDDGTPVGRISIKLNWSEIREWEIGWALHPDFWKNGYATEAVELLIGYAFSDLNAHRVVAYANTENTASEKLMTRAGMKLDGILREVRICNGKWCNEFIYSVLEHEWDK